MSDKHTIALTMEGRPADDGHVRANDLVRQLGALLSALKRSDVSSQKEETVYFRVVGLSHSSPATITLEACSRLPRRDYREDVIGSFFSTIQSIRNRTHERPVEYSLLKDLHELTRPVGVTVEKMQVQWADKILQLDQSFKENIDALMAPEETYPGAVRGMLETLNLHDGANIFRIYPDVGPSKLTCHFLSEIRDEAIAAVGRFVEVRGTLRYKSSAQYAHEIEVQTIHMFPDDDSLTSFDDLRGAAPGATGDLLSEDFIREVRSGRLQ